MRSFPLAGLSLTVVLAACSDPSSSVPADGDDGPGDGLGGEGDGDDGGGGGGGDGGEHGPSVADCVGVNLQPIADPDDAEGIWPPVVYQAIRDKGFTCARFVLFWDMFEPAAGAFHEPAFTGLGNALDHAGAAGLDVIVNAIYLGGEPAGQRSVPEWARASDGMRAATDNGLGFLAELAARYGDHPAVAGWDPVNEPYRDPADQIGVLADYTVLVDTLRPLDRDGAILIEPLGGAWEMTAADMAAFTPVDRSNLVLSVHDYYNGGDGIGFDDDGATDSDFETWDGQTGYQPSDESRANLAAHLQVWIDFAASQDMDVWVGEFGIGNGADGRDAYITDKATLYRSHGVGFAYWEYFANDGALSLTDGSGAWHPWTDLLF